MLPLITGIALGIALALIVIALLIRRRVRMQQRPKPQLSAEQRAEVSALLAEDRTIDAIVLYRRATRVSLQEAIDAVDAIASGSATGELAWEENVRRLLNAGDSAGAAAIIERTLGIGPAEARQAVARWQWGLEREPSLPGDLILEAEAHIRHGRLIPAVQLIQSRLGVSSAEARAVVDAITRTFGQGAT